VLEQTANTPPFSHGMQERRSPHLRDKKIEVGRQYLYSQERSSIFPAFHTPAFKKEGKNSFSLLLLRGKSRTSGRRKEKNLRGV